MNFLADLHFLRPLWPLAVLPVLALLAWSASRPKHGDGGWGGVIDEHLLQPLLVGRLAESRLMRRLLAALALVLTAVALAGPAWQQLPQPVLQNSRGLVLVMDLSPSMLVNDVPPSRLEAAKFKLRDVLAEFEDRPTGLIAFAGSAHVVAPISNDGNTVENLLRSLSPGMMPVPGSRIAPALLRADELLRDGGGLRGDVLLITDSQPNSAALSAAEKLADNGHRLTVLGIGTAEGSPIPDGQGAFLRDRSQRIVIAKLPQAELQRLALAGSGVYRDLAANGDDLSLLRNDSGEWLNNSSEDSQLSSDGWQDEGVWLLLPVLLLVAVGARKGLLFSLLPAAAIGLATLQPTPVNAQPAVAGPANTKAETYSETPVITPLFNTANQRGQRALQNNSPERAAELFNDPAWRATALYRAGRYEEAAAAFTKMPGAAGEYNQGNALAKSGNLEAAQEAYQRALAAKPDYADAAANLELVKKLLEQQQEQQKPEDSENGEQDKDKQDQDDQESEGGAQQDKQQGGEQSESQNGEQSQGEQSEGQQSQDQNNGQPKDDQQTNEAEQNTTGETEEGSEKEQQEAAKQSDEKSAEEQAAEKLAAEKAEEQAEQEGDQRATQQPGAQQQPMDEQQQALQQWLNRIPDDPGGLLRRKFARQQQRQQQMGQQLEADGEAGW